MKKHGKEEKIIMRRTAVLMICSAMITFAVTYFFVNLFYYNRYKNYRIISEAEDYIDKYYYSDDVDKDKLVNSALSGFVSGLGDKYSRYQDLVETAERDDAHAGVRLGVGISVIPSDDNHILIVEVNSNTPASKAKLCKDDIIIAVDGKDTAKTGYDESVEMIKNGEENSTIVLTIKRGETISDFTLKREKIEVITVEGRMLENNIGYISISSFNEKTPDQFTDNFNRLVREGARSMIFDVRNNGGGLVSAVEKCLDPLLPEGDIAVAVGKNNTEHVIVKSDADETDISMAVLVNGASASGAELFAASLRDFKDVKLIGKTTYGKGVMQDTFTLSDKSTIVLTVATYKTTRSECYNGIGLIPDYEVDNSDSDTDLQLEKAIEILQPVN